VYAAEIDVPAALDGRYDFSVYIGAGLSAVVVDGAAEDAYEVLKLIFSLVSPHSIDVFTESYDVHFVASRLTESNEFCGNF